MNAHSLAHRAYAAKNAPTRSTRSVEYEVIARITHKLKETAERGPAAFPDLAQALHENLELWTVLAADVSDPGNGLPKDLRARIFFLAQFTRQHGPKVLSGEATVAPLLEINTAVLRGLRQGAQT